MQQRNFIVFIVLSLLILATWTWLQHQIWPTPEKKAEEIQIEKAAEKKEPAEKKEKAAEKKPEEKVAKAPEKKEPEKKQEPESGKLEEATLGGDGYNLAVLLTTKGAGIRRLTLTRFEAANWLGRPVDEKLDLIPDDPIKPSFRLYHFHAPESETGYPVLGLGESLWKLDGKKEDPTGQEVRFSTHVPGTDIKITKVYRLEPTDYHVALRLEIQDERDPRDKGSAIPFRYQLTGAHGLPIEGEWYASIYRNAVIGMVDPYNSLWREMTDSASVSHMEGGKRFPEGGRGASFLQYAGTVNQYFASLVVVDDQQPEAAAGGVDKKNILAWARPTYETTEIKGNLRSIRDHRVLYRTPGGSESFYTVLPRAWHHLTEELKLQEGDDAVLSVYEDPKTKEQVAVWVRPGHTPRPQFDDLTVRVHSELLQLKPGDKVAHQFLLYNGPVKTMLLGQFSDEKAVPAELVERYTHELHLRTLTDYRSAGPFGWFSEKIFLTNLIIFFTRLMNTLLYWLHYVIPNYGLCIILLTVMVRGAMHPISRRQAQFSVKMQELAPEMKRVQEVYKDDPQAKTAAVMELYRRHKVHPLGSCLPLLMQMPIFLGLYFALQESIHFRLAPFWPLWIENLGAPDMMVWWSESIPWISDPNSLGGMLYLGPYLNLLPLIAGVFMLIQQQMMTPPPTDEQQAAQQKMMKFMTIFFCILFYKVPAGLCIYFISSSLWGLAERKMLPKKKVVAEAVVPGVGPQQVVRGGKSRGRGAMANKKEKEEDGPLQKVKGWWAEVLKQARKK